MRRSAEADGLDGGGSSLLWLSCSSEVSWEGWFGWGSFWGGLGSSCGGSVGSSFCGGGWGLECCWWFWEEPGRSIITVGIGFCSFWDACWVCWRFSWIAEASTALERVGRVWSFLRMSTGVVDAEVRRFGCLGSERGERWGCWG